MNSLLFELIEGTGPLKSRLKRFIGLVALINAYFLNNKFWFHFYTYFIGGDNSFNVRAKCNSLIMLG